MLKPRAHLIDSCTLQIEYGVDLNKAIDVVPRVEKILQNEQNLVDFRETTFDCANFAHGHCYFSQGDDIVFVFPERCIGYLPAHQKIFLACEMSNWGNANKLSQWQLHGMNLLGKKRLGLRINRFLLNSPFPFQFISSAGDWYGPDGNTPNIQISEIGSLNFIFDPRVTGNNVLQYHLTSNIAVGDSLIVQLSNDCVLDVDFSPWISSLDDDVPLGAIVGKSTTSFRIFAPRATCVRVAIFSKKASQPEYYSLQQSDTGVWHGEVRKCLEDYYYYYQILSKENDNWENSPMILDPYAKAALSSKGPGIVIAHGPNETSKDGFITPAPKDLIILEAHLRDLLAHAPMNLSAEERLNFSGLTKYLADKKCYLRELGINCVELQPIQEFDYSSKDEYHWGYMPANWFCPSSAYADNAGNATQVQDFKGMICSFHEAGIAVILDVVYNHFGDSKHLQNIDGEYYFRHGKNGELLNFSGCGNDFRTESPMARRLIMDSLEHLVRTYNVDGFRFDLAELLGMEFLDILQKRLKRVKKSVILIAEPWSFRDNIGVSMRHLPYSIWNDEYREFVKNYVCGNGNSNGLRYFLCGGLDFRSAFPSQSVNYVASHDDRGWVDNITENPHHNGGAPTDNDLRRTRLALAILIMSIGIPMVTAGQDFLFSKHGVSNTYNRGDLNALDYRLLDVHRSTHDYFKNLVKFRLSKRGIILRLSQVPNKTYFHFFPSATNSACALAYNADGTFGNDQLIFAINPHFSGAAIDFKEMNLKQCTTLADEERFFHDDRIIFDKIVDNRLILPPLSCRIYWAK
jgi:pullulanase/glycogen debranching enzyme